MQAFQDFLDLIGFGQNLQNARANGDLRAFIKICIGAYAACLAVWLLKKWRHRKDPDGWRFLSLGEALATLLSCLAELMVGVI
jgi:hypothetical protein